VDFPHKSRVPFIDYKKPSAYMVLPYFQHLFTIEMNRASIKSPKELAHSYFPRDFHWNLEHPKKNLTYYTNILIVLMKMKKRIDSTSLLNICPI
jgi:hypothetical protein